MTQNQLSRYGAISRITPHLAPGAKLFLVSDSDDTTVGPINLGAEFPVDNDGVVRVYTTIQAAVNAASANRGDVVAVMPGYDHSLGRADTWATAGVHVIGLGDGLNLPIIRYDTLGATVNVGANNVHISNLRFLSDTLITRGLDLDTGFAGAHVENCIFDFDSNGSNFITMLRVGQARSLIENNEFWAEDTSGCNKGVEILSGYPDYLKVKNNFFYGQFDTVGDSTDNAGAIAISDSLSHDSGDTSLNGLEISGNTIVSTDTAAAVLINLNGGAVAGDLGVRGIVRNNNLASYDTATADTTQVAFGNALALNNYFIDGDSDIQQGIVGKVNMVGMLDS